MSEIVKVQMPLVTNDPERIHKAYIYDRHRMHETLQKLDYTSKKLMGDDMKAFFKAEWRHTSQQWTLGTRVKGPRLVIKEVGAMIALPNNLIGITDDRKTNTATQNAFRGPEGKASTH